MHSLHRRLIPIVVVLLLLTPVAAFAQTETAARLVELVFSEDESSVKITETIESTARVTFTHDGTDYVMKVPVTIDIDETLELADAAGSTAAADRVGVFAIEVVKVIEWTEEYTQDYRTVTPSSDENKLIGVQFKMTNLSAEAQRFSDWFSDEQVIGIDDMGRTFEVEHIFGCGEINPSGTVECLAVFDVEKTVVFANMLVRAMDERTVPLPAVEEEEEEEEDS